jgi:hypothetical protein
MITSVILAMIGASLTTLILYTLKDWQKGCAINDASADSNVIFQKLNVDIREASSAVGAENELRLNIPPIMADVNGEKYRNLSATPTVYRYYLENGKIYQQIDTGQPRAFSSYSTETGITFSVSGRTVTVSTHKKDNPEQIIDKFKVVMRNYQGQE